MWPLPNQNSQARFATGHSESYFASPHPARSPHPWHRACDSYGYATVTAPSGAQISSNSYRTSSRRFGMRGTLTKGPVGRLQNPGGFATNEERLNGENGLLLTPSIDHLFDRGFIGFASIVG